MRKYYGLRIMSVFYKALALVIAITSIAAIGFMAADAYLANEAIDIVPPDTLSWTVQALGVLIVGGVILQSWLGVYVLQAATLEEAVAAHSAMSLSSNELTQLAAYLHQIDGSEPAPLVGGFRE